MTKRNDGAWLFLITTCLVSALLFLANQPVVAGLYHWLSPLWPRVLGSQGARQFIIFVGPIALLFFEWWLIDSLFGIGAKAAGDHDD